LKSIPPRRDPAILLTPISKLRLMGVDEEGTLAALKAMFSQKNQIERLLLFALEIIWRS
jgi:hypothetical protein